MPDHGPDELIARIDDLLASNEPDGTVGPDAMRWTGQAPADEEIDPFYHRVAADELDRRAARSIDEWLRGWVEDGTITRDEAPFTDEL